eukprot:6186880-Pleurochrysis_carterae.AAC.2
MVGTVVVIVVETVVATVVTVVVRVVVKVVVAVVLAVVVTVVASVSVESVCPGGTLQGSRPVRAVCESGPFRWHRFAAAKAAEAGY